MFLGEKRVKSVGKKKQQHINTQYCDSLMIKASFFFTANSRGALRKIKYIVDSTDNDPYNSTCLEKESFCY